MTYQKKFICLYVGKNLGYNNTYLFWFPCIIIKRRQAKFYLDKGIIFGQTFESREGDQYFYFDINSGFSIDNMNAQMFAIFNILWR